MSALLTYLQAYIQPLPYPDSGQSTSQLVMSELRH